MRLFFPYSAHIAIMPYETEGKGRTHFMEGTTRGLNFLEEIITEDLRAGRVTSVVTRFPPEPNGYLHIGHAKSICINFGLAEKFGGECNLRFDDTNPAKEETEYVDAIQRDVAWLGFRWAGAVRYASDYFDRFYRWAIELIEAGKAYVDDQSAEEIRANRGTLTEPGKNSPWRDRTVGENLDLFERMRCAEFPDGSRVLRAKIDMAHPNINMRDPVLYRILNTDHHRTGWQWCIYPMYDFAHGYEDSIEGVTHSICTLEFQDHRPLYDWFIDNVSTPSKPHQYEFARLNLSHTVMSKRKLLQLVREKYVSGWDDPRMPTISGLRRRGYTPSSVRRFCELIGVAKADSMVEIELLEHCLREELNAAAQRAMAVLRPLKLVIGNWPGDRVEMVQVENNPEDPNAGSREVPFCRELWIESDDFMEVPKKGFFRLSPGTEVRLKGAYVVRCDEVVKDSSGAVVELRCTYDPATKSGDAAGRKVRGTLHWVSARHGVHAEVRLYDVLFTLRNLADMEEGRDYREYLNPESLVVCENAVVEPMLASAKEGESFQFLRQGYFCVDRDSTPERLVFNRSVALKDAWARIQARG
jgi:glutaminyl-tRNA synthetase